MDRECKCDDTAAVTTGLSVGLLVTQRTHVTNIGAANYMRINLNNSLNHSRTEFP